MTDQKTKNATSPTVITITLLESEEESRSGTLIVARGELAHIRQFTYANLSDLTAILKQGVVALTALEADPPKDTRKSLPPAPPPVQAEVKPKDEEPTVDVPLKKGSLAVKISTLKIVGGETDAAAYRQAVLIAGRLIDGQLWDGKTPVRIDDVYAVQKKLKHLSDKDLSMFDLTDFVLVGDSAAPAADSTGDQPDVNDADTDFDAQTIAASSSDQSALL